MSKGSKGRMSRFSLVIPLLTALVAVADGCRLALESECEPSSLTSFVGCIACADRVEACGGGPGGDADVDAGVAVSACRGIVGATAPDPQDPPFDLSKVQFSGTFSDHVVLQQEPNVAAVFGTAKPGATVVVTLAGPGGFSYSSPPTDVTTSPSDPAVHGTWKVLLPARLPGFGYTVTATCADCSNTTRATLSDVGFGLVFLCSGQSNMEDPVLTTASRNESYAQAATGIYDHIRIFQTGWRLQRESSTWILPQHPDDQQGYPEQSWQLPRGCPDALPGPAVPCSLQRFSAVCWYFGKSLADQMNESAADGAAPVPLGLIHSSIGGTTIQQWMPPATTTNATCADNNCGYSVAKNTSAPSCTNASLSTVWSCPSNHCSQLYHGMIAPFVNMTITGAIWYQGEQNILFGEGSVLNKSGYACQQAAMISSWREAFSADAGTTNADFPFGVTSLAGGCSEGFPVWSPYQHFSRDEFESCAAPKPGGMTHKSPICEDMGNDWAGGLRVAQTAGYGHMPNAALPNTFLGQAYDHGEPCSCDRKAVAPGGCWANGQCYGWTSPYSLNRTWNYQNSGIHPRPKLMVGVRLARAALGLLQSPPKPQPVPKLAGCRLESATRIVLSFDHGLLGDEAVGLQAPGPGKIPLELRIGPGVPVGPNNSSGWVYAANLEVVNATAIAVMLPPGSPTPTAIRYAWGSYPCCPGLDSATFFCPPAACPIVTTATKEPAVPFWAHVEAGRCRCDPPWKCDA